MAEAITLAKFPRRLKKFQRESAETKICKNCAGDPQPIENFGKNKAVPDGLKDICKKCESDYQRKRYYELKAAREMY